MVLFCMILSSSLSMSESSFLRLSLFFVDFFFLAISTESIVLVNLNDPFLWRGVLMERELALIELGLSFSYIFLETCYFSVSRG